VAIESVEIVHEGIYQITPMGLLANAAEAILGGGGSFGF
jgi:hypothetical protein